MVSNRIYLLLLFTIFSSTSVSAHMESWNRAELSLDENILTLNLTVVETDLLNEITGETEIDWEALRPTISEYFAKNVSVTVDETELPLTTLLAQSVGEQSRFDSQMDSTLGIQHFSYFC